MMEFLEIYLKYAILEYFQCCSTRYKRHDFVQFRSCKSVQTRLLFLKSLEFKLQYLTPNPFLALTILSVNPNCPSKFI